MGLNVLVIGGGGREHAIVHKLSQSSRISKLYCASGNGGISQLAECVPLKATDIEGVVSFAKKSDIDFVVVAPDDPLVFGMVDALEAVGIKAFGPRANAAIIEGSKVFSKQLMKKYNIPTAGYEVFDKADEAIEYVRKSNTYPTVVKADGLALGKGVIIATSFEEAEAAIKSIMEDKIFGASGSKVVIEEFLTGPEVSVLAFTDGKSLKPMVSAQDHKRVYDNDQGPNTGGMGTFSPSRIYTDEIAKFCMKEIYLPTMNALNTEDRTFKGIIFFGLMITKNGPKVIEYNARFGDPETQVILPRLKTDLMDIFEAVADERLSEIEIEWEDNAAVCVVLASGGYPQKYETGKLINGINKAEGIEGITVYHAGTICENGRFYTAGGRVLGVTAVDSTLDLAINRAYKAVGEISFEGAHYRKDIGVK